MSALRGGETPTIAHADAAAFAVRRALERAFPDADRVQLANLCAVALGVYWARAIWPVEPGAAQERALREVILFSAVREHDALRAVGAAPDGRADGRADGGAP